MSFPISSATAVGAVEFRTHNLEPAGFEAIHLQPTDDDSYPSRRLVMQPIRVEDMEAEVIRGLE